MRTERIFVDNKDGWLLALERSWDETKLRKDRAPALIIPGYGMNSFIFGWHPSGPSLVGFLAEKGYEVWRVDLRSQGNSVRQSGGYNFSLADLALTDLSHTIDAVLKHTFTEKKQVSLLGASLGGTIMFIYAALSESTKSKVNALISLGAPVRWVRVHPLVKVMFSSPTLVGLVRFRGTRKLAETVLPVFVRHAPWLLRIYLNPDITDTTAVREMVQTVEDPNRHINREIAQWIRDRDLNLRGKNLTDAIKQVDLPLLCIAASHDGIVPLETASFPFHQVKSKVRAMVEVGDQDLKVAHADLFISRHAHDQVFQPISDWLDQQ